MDWKYCQIIIDRLLLSILWNSDLLIQFNPNQNANRLQELKIWFSNLFGNINNKLRTAKTVSKRKNKVEGVLSSDSKLNTRTTWYCHKGGHISHKSAESRNRLQCRWSIDCCQNYQDTSEGKRIIFFNKFCWNNQIYNTINYDHIIFRN